MMDGVPTLLKFCIDPIPYTLCHILLPSFYLYLIAHFYYFDLLIFDYLNGRMCIARLMLVFGKVVSQYAWRWMYGPFAGTFFLFEKGYLLL